MHGHRSSRHRRPSNRGAGTAALSLGLCLCAGQLIASSPASAAAPTTTAVTPAVKAAATTTKAVGVAKVTPRLNTSLSTRSIPWGSSVRVTSKVINPATGKIAKGQVRLQYWIKGAWRTSSSKNVTSGAVTFNAKPTSTVVVRTLFVGSGYNWRVSPQIKVTVRPSGAKILAEAKKHKGALYKFGASGPSRFDCSGFTKYVYKKAAGKSLPHKANSQQSYGKAIAKNKKQIGDLVVFRNGSYGYHAGIYAGNGYIYDSPRTGSRVGLHKIWNNNYVVRRLAA